MFRHPRPPEPKDAAAADALLRLLRAAVEDLAELGPSPVVVAAAPGRFNDVAWYPWQLVRVGAESVEHDEYDGTRKQFVAALAKGSASVQHAGSVLERLEAAQWRDVFLRAYELPLNDEFLAVVIQYELPWFIYASSNIGGREHVFALWQDELEYFGECVSRTDDELIDERGLVFARELDGGHALDWP